MPPRWQPCLQPSPWLESPFQCPRPPPLLSMCSISSTRTKEAARSASLSVDVKTHPNQQFPGRFVDHTPSCLHFLFCVPRPLCFPQRGGDTVTLGVFPRVGIPSHAGGYFSRGGGCSMIACQLALHWSRLPTHHFGFLLCGAEVVCSRPCALRGPCSVAHANLCAQPRECSRFKVPCLIFFTGAP